MRPRDRDAGSVPGVAGGGVRRYGGSLWDGGGVWRVFERWCAPDYASVDEFDGRGGGLE